MVIYVTHIANNVITTLLLAKYGDKHIAAEAELSEVCDMHLIRK